MQNILSKRPIFVIGVPRSGTTVISETISAHASLSWFSNYFNLFPLFPEVSVINRVLDLPKFGWYLIGKKKQKRGIFSTLRKALPHSVEAYSIWEKYCGKTFLFDYLIDTNASQNTKISMQNAVERTLIYHGKKRFITKLTGPPRIQFIKSIFNDAIFLHILRDPRAVVSSLLNVDFWIKNKGHSEPWWKNGLSIDYINEWKQHKKHPAALAAIQWKQIVQLTWQEKLFLKERDFIEVRYEDFVKDSRNILRTVLKSIDLNYTQEIEKYISSIGQIEDMTNKYKNLLDTTTINMIEAITRDTARKAGYNY